MFHFPSSNWNYNEVRRLLPNATFLTILRDPVACFESNFVYMGLQQDFGMDINQFAGSEVLHINFYKNTILGIDINQFAEIGILKINFLQILFTPIHRLHND